MKATNPVYGSWHLGITQSKKVQSGLDDMSNCDTTSQLGSLLCQKRLEHMDSTVNEPCYQAVAPNGDTYFFSQTSGKIWKRTYLGVYSLVRTDANGSHKGAGYYNGYILYTSDAKLGKYIIATDSWNDSYQSLTAGVAHPIFQFDLIVYIGNGKDVAQLDDADVFSASGLDLPAEHKVSALMDMGDDLLTLSNPGNYISSAAVFRWNTYSPSWTAKDKILETNAYAFLYSDNYTYIVCTTGDIYYYDGSNIQLKFFIRNAAETFGHQLTTNRKGKPLIANGGRIYSLYRKSADLSIALVGEFTCSAGEDATIYSIAANGSNLLVSWGLNGVYGVDEISANLAVAKVITPHFGKWNKVKVYYEDLNGGTIGIEHQLDGSNTWISHEVMDDSDDKRFIRTVDDMIIESGAQARVTITPDPDNLLVSPVIDKVSIE